MLAPFGVSCPHTHTKNIDVAQNESCRLYNRMSKKMHPLNNYTNFREYHRLPSPSNKKIKKTYSRKLVKNETNVRSVKLFNTYVSSLGNVFRTQSIERTNKWRNQISGRYLQLGSKRITTTGSQWSMAGLAHTEQTRNRNRTNKR